MIVLTDAQTIMRAHVAALLDGRTEPYAAGVTVGTTVPSGSTGEPGLPYVQVVQDGTPRTRWPRTDDCTVRVTWWAPAHRPSDARAGARLVQALIGSAPRPAGVWSVRGLTGPLPARDPDTGHQMCSVTFRVSTRPTN